MTVGVDVGGTKCLAVALDGDRVVAERLIPVPDDAPAIVAAIAGLVEDVGSTRGSPGSPEVGDVVAVGVGLPGLVDREGVLQFAPNLPGGNGLAVEGPLEGRLGVPVHVDNDATCAAWGEHQHGAAQGVDDMLLVTLGTGIGGGIVSGGRVHRGAYGFAGEVGHMVVAPEGEPCPCGKRGCWERYASGSGLGRLAREAAHDGHGRRMVELAGGDPEDVKGEHVTAAALEGDDDAQAVLDGFAWWLALGLSNLASIFDPQMFVVGGGLVAAGQVLFGPARTEFAGMLTGTEHRPAIGIVPAVLGPQAGAIGAASLALEKTFGSVAPSNAGKPASRPLH